MDWTISIVLSLVGISYFIVVSLMVGIQRTDAATFQEGVIYTNELSKLFDDSWAFGFAFAGAVGNAATALALIFVWRQQQMTQEEMTVTLRAWIGNSGVELANKGLPDQELQVFLKNYGRIPARIVALHSVMDDSEFKRTEIANNEPTNLTNVAFFPESQPHRPVSIELRGKTPLFVGILLEYEYADNKRGIYGLIERYDKNRGKYMPVDEWFV